jgi:hypothetical protein
MPGRIMPISYIMSSTRDSIHTLNLWREGSRKKKYHGKNHGSHQNGGIKNKSGLDRAEIQTRLRLVTITTTVQSTVFCRKSKSVPFFVKLWFNCHLRLSVSITVNLKFSADLMSASKQPKSSAEYIPSRMTYLYGEGQRELTLIQK